jgi:hypothetical protein
MKTSNENIENRTHAIEVCMNIKIHVLYMYAFSNHLTEMTECLQQYDCSCLTHDAVVMWCGIFLIRAEFHISTKNSHSGKSRV